MTQPESNTDLIKAAIALKGKGVTPYYPVVGGATYYPIITADPDRCAEEARALCKGMIGIREEEAHSNLNGYMLACIMMARLETERLLDRVIGCAYFVLIAATGVATYLLLA